MESKFQVSPDVGRYNSADDDNVTQVFLFFRNAELFIRIVLSDLNYRLFLGPEMLLELCNLGPS